MWSTVYRFLQVIYRKASAFFHSVMLNSHYKMPKQTWHTNSHCLEPCHSSRHKRFGWTWHLEGQWHVWKWIHSFSFACKGLLSIMNLGISCITINGMSNFLLWHRLTRLFSNYMHDRTTACTNVWISAMFFLKSWILKFKVKTIFKMGSTFQVSMFLYHNAYIYKPSIGFFF